MRDKIKQKEENLEHEKHKLKLIHTSKFFYSHPTINEQSKLSSASRTKNIKFNSVRPYSSALIKTTYKNEDVDLTMPVDQRNHKRVHNTKISSLIRKSKRRARDGYTKDH